MPRIRPLTALPLSRGFPFTKPGRQWAEPQHVPLPLVRKEEQVSVFTIRASATYLARTLALILAVVCLASSARAQSGDMASEPEELQTVPEAPVLLQLSAAVEEALASNGRLAGDVTRAAALLHLPSQVGTLPDPMVSFRVANLPADTFRTGQINMTNLQVGVTQSIPFPGKLASRRKAAESDAGTAGHRADETRLVLVRDVVRSWWRVFYLDRALEVVAANQELLRQFIKSARTKYAVGQGLQQDVLLGELELSRLIDQEISLHGVSEAEEARLRALLNRPADTYLILPGEAIIQLPRIGSADDYFETARIERPLLQSFATMIHAADARQTLAERDFYPDLNLNIAYGFRSGHPDSLGGRQRPDLVSAGISFTIPVFLERRQRQALRQRSGELLATKYAEQDTKSAVYSEISTAISAYQTARQRSEFIEDGIVPQARLTLDSMRAGYLVGQVDFLNLIRAQITLQNFELEYWKVVTDAQRSLASLAAASGREKFDE